MHIWPTDNASGSDQGNMAMSASRNRIEQDKNESDQIEAQDPVLRLRRNTDENIRCSARSRMRKHWYHSLGIALLSQHSCNARKWELVGHLCQTLLTLLHL